MHHGEATRGFIHNPWPDPAPFSSWGTARRLLQLSFLRLPRGCSQKLEAQPPWGSGDLSCAQGCPWGYTHWELEMAELGQKHWGLPCDPSSRAECGRSDLSGDGDLAQL